MLLHCMNVECFNIECGVSQIEQNKMRRKILMKIITKERLAHIKIYSWY